MSIIIPAGISALLTVLLIHLNTLNNAAIEVFLGISIVVVLIEIAALNYMGVINLKRGEFSLPRYAKFILIGDPVLCGIIGSILFVIFN